MEENRSIMSLSNCSRLNQAVTVVVFISFKVATEGATHFMVKDSRQVRLGDGREEMRWKNRLLTSYYTHIFTGKLVSGTAFPHHHKPLYH